MFFKDNGIKEIEKKDTNWLKMVIITVVFVKIKNKERDNLNGWMVRLTVENGKMVKDMELDFGFQKMEIVIWDNGRKELYKVKGYIKLITVTLS